MTAKTDNPNTDTKNAQETVTTSQKIPYIIPEIKIKPLKPVIQGGPDQQLAESFGDALS